MKSEYKIRGGLAGKILRVDLSKNKIWTEDTEKYARRWIGGRAINTWILLNEMKPETKWSDPENILIFGAGALVGTLAPGACRVSVDSKNAFNNGKGSSNFGGHWGAELKYAGFDHIVIIGKAEKPVYLWIEDGKAEIRDADFLWGKTTDETEEILQKELGDERIKVVCIGPAGENRVKAAGIIAESGRSAGGCGLGCIMGDKKLKAIAVRGHGAIKVAEPEKFMEAVQKAFKKILSNRFAKPFREKTLAGCLFTDAKVHDPVWNTLFTAKNSQEDYWPRERRAKICGALKYRKKVYACFNCPVGCTPFSEIEEGKYKGTKGNGFWVNSFYWPARMDVDDPAAAFKYHVECNRLGLDGDNSSVVLSWAFECYEKGLISKEDTDGLELTWGNAEAMLELQRKLAYREGFGDFLADGVVKASKKLGKGSDRFAIHQKGQDSADPYRIPKGWALGCCTSPIGGRHMRGSVHTYLAYGPGVKYDHLSYEDVPDIVFWQLRAKEVEDILGMCSYGEGTEDGIPHALMPSDFAELASYAFGIELSEDELMLLGLRSYNLEKAFNTIHAGFTRKDDLPHRRFLEEPVPSGPYKGEKLDKEKFDKMLDRFYELLGWDKKTSWQTRKCLEELDMADVAEMLAKVGRLIE